MKQEYKKVIELSLQEITIRSDNKFTMQCYNTFTELGCHIEISSHQIYDRSFSDFQKDYLQ